MINENIKILYDKIIIYLSDLKQFTKNFKSKHSDLNTLQIITEKAYELAVVSEKLIQENYPNKEQIINNIQKISDNILSELKDLSCPNNFIFEKSDLLSTTFLIWEKCSQLLSFDNIL